MRKVTILIIILNLIVSWSSSIMAQPDWSGIKNNATFIVPDLTYGTPYIQPLNIGGWEDGLYISRNGQTLYSYFLPFDVFSLYSDWALDPDCFNSQPYFRPPLINNDTISNPWGCQNFFQGDIIIATRDNTTSSFNSWQSSNLIRSISNEGAPCAVSLNQDTLDVFVFTQNRNDVDDLEIMFMRNVPNNPSLSTAIPILSSLGEEDNPHIERLNETTLLIIFDRNRFVYYSKSFDNGTTWEIPTLITHVINDQSPYDVQPHLWNDGTDWWIYFCADNFQGKRCIYKSKQQIQGDWDSWGAKELVIEPSIITGNYGSIIGVGEPSLTQWGDISFVVVYGDLTSNDTTNVFDCDPWFLPKIGSPLSIAENKTDYFSIYPNPVTDILKIKHLKDGVKKINIYNIDGQLVKTINIFNETTIDVSNFLKGVYFIQLPLDNNKSIKFIKQ